MQIHIALISILTTFAVCSRPVSAEKATDANSVRMRGKQLTVKDVENAYLRTSGYDSDEPDSFIKLKDGKWKNGVEEATVTRVVLGDLNKDGITDAAAIYWESGGGSGCFYRVTAFVSKGGRLMAVDKKILGDRVGIRDLRIEKGVIIADVLSHGPDDSVRGPTVKKTARYTLKNNKLIGPDSMY